jgi:hypothetical protein
MYPTVAPQPWQHIVWVRHSQVRGGMCDEVDGRQEVRGRRTSGLELYAEQFTGRASEEYNETFGRNSRTAYVGG